MKSINERFHNVIRLLVRKLNHLDRDEKVCYGLTMAQCDTLETVNKYGTITMNVLRKEMGVAISTMTRICDILVRDGLVDRCPSSVDRRKVCIELTDKGRELAVKLKECSRSYSSILLEQIPSEDRENLVAMLIKLVEAIENARNNCCVQPER